MDWKRGDTSALCVTVIMESEGRVVSREFVIFIV